MNASKRLLTVFLIAALLLTPPGRNQSKAWMAPLCVAAIALIVGGVAVYTIYSCLRKTPPPKPGDEEEEEDDNAERNMVTLMNLPGETPVRAGGSGGRLNITIEMSEDMVHWQAVGVCRNTTLTDFVFHHTNSLPRAFYRAALY